MNPEDFKDGGRFQVGRVVQAKNATYESARTEPPKRYTQSDLIDVMMNAARFAKSPKERELLRQIAGLGTSRTREATITGMVDRGLLCEIKASRSRSRVEMQPSEAAITIIENLPEMLTDPATTAKWELAFQMLEQGKASLQDVLRYFEGMLHEVVAQAKSTGSLTVYVQKASPPSNPHFSKPSAKKAAASGAR